MRSLDRHVVFALLACATACGPRAPEPPPRPPSCVAGSCGRDGGPTTFVDAGSPSPSPDVLPACSRHGFGARGCDTGFACRDGLTCFRELRLATEVESDGVTHALEAVAFAGGLCSTRCETSEDCGPCAECVPYVLAGRARLAGPLRGSGVCRRRCGSRSLCSVESDACDFETDACLEGCVDDAQCAFRTIDTDGDGVEDMLVHSPEDDARCVDRRCRVPPVAGSPCGSDADCAPDQECTRGRDWNPLRPGRCETADCELCVEGERCVSGTCATVCVIGADEPEAITGVEGHGRGCAPGFRCEERPYEPKGDPREGVCRPGTYNDVEAPNLGARCASHDECYSPYGRGACLPEYWGGPSSCTLTTCISDVVGIIGFRPDVAVDPALWCDPDSGFSCIGGQCMRACARAEECHEREACVLRPRADTRLCSAECLTEYDCRETERCNAADGTRCDIHDRDCACGPP